MTDTAFVQSIIDSSSKPFIPDGTYTIGRLVIPADTHVEASPRAEFVAAPGLNEPMIDLSGAHRSKWKGGKFSFNGLSGVGRNVFHAMYTDDLEISHAHITDGGQFGVVLKGGTNTRLSDIIVNQAKRGGIYGESGVRTTISGCTVQNAISFHGIQLVDGDGHLIARNYVCGSHEFNINMLGCRFSKIASNLCEESRLEGINVQDCDHWEILDNVCRWFGSPSKGLDFGISAWGANGKFCNFGTVARNTVSASAKAGIVLFQQVLMSQVIDNRVVNCNRVNDSLSASIAFYNAQGNNLASGNHLFSNLGWTQYGIYGASGNQVPANSNVSIGHTVAAVA